MATSWLFSPYVKLAAEVLALVLAAAVAGAFIGAGRRLPGVVVVVAILLAALLLPRVWASAENNRSVRATLGTPLGQSPHALCLRDDALRKFVRWLAPRIPSRERFAGMGAVDRTCLQLNLLPRQLVPPSQRPRWTVVVGRPPRKPPAGWSIEVFDADKALLARL